VPTVQKFWYFKLPGALRLQGNLTQVETQNEILEAAEKILVTKLIKGGENMVET
jgi:hypothetical protein